MAGVPSIDSEKALEPKKYHVPVILKDISSFDGAFTFMKERFNEEMRRIEEEMVLLSKNLLKFTESKTYQTMPASVDSCFWETISNSPLVEGEGEDKTMRLQFDVSQFQPSEVVVKILDNKLIVTAQHEEKSDANVIHNQYHREFHLPSGVVPESLQSTLTKDGVLSVKVPLKFTGLAIDRPDQYYI